MLEGRFTSARRSTWLCSRSSSARPPPTPSRSSASRLVPSGHTPSASLRCSASAQRGTRRPSADLKKNILGSSHCAKTSRKLAAVHPLETSASRVAKKKALAQGHVCQRWYVGRSRPRWPRCLGSSQLRLVEHWEPSSRDPANRRPRSRWLGSLRRSAPSAFAVGTLRTMV